MPEGRSLPAGRRRIVTHTQVSKITEKEYITMKLKRILLMTLCASLRSEERRVGKECYS